MVPGLAPRLARRSARAARSIMMGAGVASLRTLGRVLPSPVLWVLLWPLGMLRAGWELAWGRPTLGEFRKLSGTPLLRQAQRLRPRRLLLSRTRLNLAKMLFLWPERLVSLQGDPRCLEGAERLDLLRSSPAPAVLLTLHFGPLRILHQFLRTMGFPVSIVAATGRQSLPRYRRCLASLADAAGGVAMVPRSFEAGGTWEMLDHLGAGRILLVAAEDGKGRHVCTPVMNGLGLSLHTGSLQLAAMTEATIIPCLIRSRPRFSFTIHLGEPLRPGDPADRSWHAAACEHLLQEFLPILAAAPEECSFDLLVALERVDPASPSRAPPAIP